MHNVNTTIGASKDCPWCEAVNSKGKKTREVTHDIQVISATTEFRIIVSEFRQLSQGTSVDGHRPANVKRAVIGSKGGWKLSTIFLSCKVFHDWSIIKLGNILYLLDGSIFAVLFGTTSHCFC